MVELKKKGASFEICCLIEIEFKSMGPMISTISL